MKKLLLLVVAMGVAAPAPAATNAEVFDTAKVLCPFIVKYPELRRGHSVGSVALRFAEKQRYTETQTYFLLRYCLHLQWKADAAMRELKNKA